MAKAKKCDVDMSVDIVPANDSLAQFDLQASVVVGKLTSNAAELRAAVERELQSYSVDRYLDDPVAAKRDKAFLSKASGQVAAKRLEVTKAWNKPLEKFLGEMKSIEASIKEGCTRLNSIVQEAEQREKDAKLGQIEEYFSSLGFTAVPLSRIMDQKWLNKSMTLKKVMAEIDGRVRAIEADIETLRGLADGQDGETVLGLYLDSLSLNLAMAEAGRLKELRAKAREVVAEVPEDVCDGKDEQGQAQDTNGTHPADAERAADGQPEEVFTYKLVFGSMGDVEAVAHFCRGHGITGGSTVQVTGRRGELALLRDFIDTRKIQYNKE